jgi:hypothetical protein
VEFFLVNGSGDKRGDGPNDADTVFCLSVPDGEARSHNTSAKGSSQNDSQYTSSRLRSNRARIFPYGIMRAGCR